MESLNHLINRYTKLLQEGDIQRAYQGIMEFLRKLQVHNASRHPQYTISDLYQGKMDMSFFSISTSLLKANGLKLAIVYLHQKGRFEAWLSARNREIAKKFLRELQLESISQLTVFHDESNPDAIIECVLSQSPDFDNPALLMEDITKQSDCFVKEIEHLLAGE